ncbi:galectin-related protein A-like isoform X3 [Notechis scutatus]|uniref:Galectin n=1 Tax=Notechis scutatus TaxID=8663 RepID=A0A6J1U7Q3_9SAUR|nr:galectin-related protein A-like isoform X3 [Notechis scutatus]
MFVWTRTSPQNLVIAVYKTKKATLVPGFSVTLLCEPKDDHATRDIGLLLVVSFSEKSIVRNSQIAGKWGKEEKTIPYFPFTAEDSFKMELLCEHQQIRILLDGRQLCSFSHRVQPVQRMTVLQISGDLKLTKVA